MKPSIKLADTFDLEQAQNAFSTFAEIYDHDSSDFDYAELQAYEFHDYTELYEMRQRCGRDLIAEAKRAAWLVAFHDDARGYVRVVRAGFSQAPPARNDNALAWIVERAA